MEPEKVQEIRSAWFTQIAHRIVPEALVACVPKIEQLPPYEQAVVVLGVGIGHMLGIDDDDLTFGSILTHADVEYIISSWWRTGYIDPDVAAWLMQTIQSMVWAIKHLQRKSNSCLLQWFEHSDLRNRVLQYWQHFDDDHVDFNSQIQDLCMPMPDCDSLSELFEALLRHYPSMKVLLSLSPLESRLLGVDPERDSARELLQGIRHTLYIPQIVPGSWPGMYEGPTPGWVEEIVTVDGARLFHSGSGYIASVFFVAESDEDEQALQKWMYSPEIGYRFENDNLAFLVIILQFPEGPGYLEYRYYHNDNRSADRLKALLGTGFLRLEIYRLCEDGTVRHRWNFGIDLMDSLAPLEQHLREWTKSHSPSLWPTAPSSTDVLQRMKHREQSLFESVLVPLSARNSSEEIDQAWKRRLQVLVNAANQYGKGGIIDDAQLAETHEILRNAESHRRPEPTAPLSTKCLGPHRAFLQLTVTSDGYIDGAAAYIDDSGEQRAQIIDLSRISFEGPSRNYRTLSIYLAEAFAELDFLLDKGVKDLVLNVGSGIYNIPFHDALLMRGFSSVSYLHSLNVLRQPSSGCSNPQSQGIVVGYPGSGKQFLSAVGAEIELIGRVAKLNQQQTVPSTWPSIAHVTGHGTTGCREFEVGIDLGPDGGFLSGPRILQQIDASATEVAFLSACNSGAGDFQIGHQIRAVPLDVALLEKGCTAVVSTAAPVNDFVAMLFSTLFHWHYAKTASIWNSYASAREAFAQNPPLLPEEVQILMDQHFPQWRSSLPSSQFETWRLFRLSGTHWDIPESNSSES